MRNVPTASGAVAKLDVVQFIILYDFSRKLQSTRAHEIQRTSCASLCEQPKSMGGDWPQTGAKHRDLRWRGYLDLRKKKSQSRGVWTRKDAGPEKMISAQFGAFTKISIFGKGLVTDASAPPLGLLT